jgi:SAM-dependent methyltransferase
MNNEFTDIYHLVEEKHFWFRGRRDLVLKELSDLSISKDSFILEVGCSGGPLLKTMSKIGYLNVFGIDICADAIDKCKSEKLFKTSVMDATTLDFEDNYFDMIIASDILEHIENQEKALQEWNRVLKPGGLLCVYVPALMSLWSDHDTVNHHFRRYKKSELVSILKLSNFSVLKSSYWNMFLFPLIYVIRTISRCLKLKNKGDLKPPGKFNFLFYLILVIENNLLRFFSFPIGVSVYAICKNNKTS